jgi:DNA-binding MarR family transcriptional regulator
VIDSSPPEGPPGLGRCTGYVFGHAGLLLLEAVEAALEPHGLQMRHVAVMLVLDSSKRPLSQQELSALLTLDPARMVTIVDKLEELGYAERRRDPDDRRRSIVTLKPAGKKALDRAMDVVDESEAEFLRPLDTDEREQLGRAARKLMAPRWATLSPELVPPG